MKIRKSILPHGLTDMGSTVFLAICIPAVFIFEIVIILPAFFEPGTLMYILHIVLGTFLLFNVTANKITMMLRDTSIKGEKLVPSERTEKLWKMCAVCETLTPPRTWHCNTCNTCILRRDHHCAFTGCCVGHTNQRYFLMLLGYLFLSTFYASLYNNYFIWVIHADKFLKSATILKLAFPLFMIAWDQSTETCYLAGYLINMVGVFFIGFLLIYHMRNVLRGTLTHEKTLAYDLGVKRNIEMVFGVRWYLTWISPFVTSDLPHDGIHWGDVLEEASKNR
ncbi:probable palmitoyltransferase ZDHHC24 [Bradysia coprophila]|uniref:probable palmitoyltransferase ZDHHC24 n=1 Tax=Bradysia coprophila TaxID=38358 RepID=UPI00187D8D87|nr:probable palmitoyltransferase ZDHHC24 [Bradysia coprophila]